MPPPHLPRPSGAKEEEEEEVASIRVDQAGGKWATGRGHRRRDGVKVLNRKKA